ncbi:MAG: TetR family transcriptional regulator [Henriciella sp.]
MSEQVEQSAAERRRERQRLHIIAQAEQLYVENGGDNGGFENTTVEAIAERSDISLRTFFRYFESKQDVIYLDSAQALLDLEKFTRARLESESPAQAALNGRLDQIRHFCSSKASRARMRRSLRSPEFRDGLNKMRGKIEAKIATLLAPHFEGSAAERGAQARMTASLTTTLVAPMLTPEKLKASTDFDAEIAASRANLERLLGQMSLNKK